MYLKFSVPDFAILRKCVVVQVRILEPNGFCPGAIPLTREATRGVSLRCFSRGPWNADARIKQLLVLTLQATDQVTADAMFEVKRL